ncbi:MAG TPA: hypothetical protein PKZ32_02040 [Candidatus Melainabacteria bacterium]|nr:hypothetical protein [Candidatus Melainabacteria bacterium]
MQGIACTRTPEAGFIAWLEAFPESSIARLRAINRSTSSSRHIILALAYGLTDLRIAKLNGLITGLMLRRMQAERKGDCRRTERIENVLHSLHLAIDKVTGFPGSKINGDEQICRARNPVKRAS